MRGVLPSRPIWPLLLSRVIGIGNSAHNGGVFIKFCGKIEMREDRKIIKIIPWEDDLKLKLQIALT